MILEVRQISAGIAHKYDIYINNYFTYTAEISPFSRCLESNIKDKEENVILRTKHEPFNRFLNIPLLELLYKKPRVQRYCKVIGKENDGIGSFQLSVYGIWKSLYEVKLKDSTYYGYRVSKGDYNYVAIYDGNNQIALIEKFLCVINRKDIYKLYLLDKYSELSEFLSMFTVYYDNWNYTARGSFSYGVVKSKEWTFSKYNSMYDPEWKKVNFNL